MMTVPILKEGDQVEVLRMIKPDTWKRGSIKRVCHYGDYDLYYLVTLELSQLTVEVSPKHIREVQ